jgi:hypothetical protein
MSCLADEVEKCDVCLITSQRVNVVGVMMYEDVCTCPVCYEHLGHVNYTEICLSLTSTVGMVF